MLTDFYHGGNTSYLIATLFFIVLALQILQFISIISRKYLKVTPFIVGLIFLIVLFGITNTFGVWESGMRDAISGDRYPHFQKFIPTIINSLNSTTVSLFLSSILLIIQGINQTVICNRSSGVRA